MLSVSSSCGLPICLTGIPRPLPFSQELEDHERRRESVKRKKFQEFLQLHEMITREASGHGSNNRGGGVVKTEFYPCISLPSTAKAA
ncbi:hypothetical protein SASPL_157563 [Salvia splendens]|uniref:Uncharacterized protein n=1 Tax=Salvia splendens TaxID=180675 RepID=A0A8X8VUP0_SALSN|nr:hypothetical protein SASPL_157563 [Salvia splendens]